MASYSISGLSSYSQGDLISNIFSPTTLEYQPIDRSNEWVLFNAPLRMKSMTASSSSGSTRPTSGLVYPRLI